jgi:hypothetical protein
MEKTLRKVISGGQLGADIAAIDATIETSGYQCGGYVPRGRLTENGQIDAKYFGVERLGCGFVETENSRYTHRTRLNASQSDGTLAIKMGKWTNGTRMTCDYCRGIGKEYYIADPYRPTLHVPQAAKWVILNNIEVLNVAGPRASRRHRSYAMTYQFISDLLWCITLYQRWNIKIWDPKRPSKQKPLTKSDGAIT